MWTTLKPILCLFAALQVRGDDCPYDGNLQAGEEPSITIFNQSLAKPYDRIFNTFEDGMECMWVIETSDTTKQIQLNFPTFHLQNSSGAGAGDCVAIYDGSEYFVDEDHLIQELCDRMPEPVYSSVGDMTVVFRQGRHEGWRWMSMNYTLGDPVEGSADDSFWTTTAGRVISFVILIIVFGFFSVIFKGFKGGRTSRGDNCLCEGLCECLRALCGLVSRCLRRCSALCTARCRAWKTRLRSRSEQAETGRSPSDHSSRSEDQDDSEIGIATISGTGEQGTGPDFSAFFSSTGMSGESQASTDIDTPYAPPPDYSSVCSPSATTRREEGGLSDPPDYSSDPLPPPPPPDDDTAPPSYEMPTPPSYSSLFNSSNA